MKPHLTHPVEEDFADEPDPESEEWPASGRDPEAPPREREMEPREPPREPATEEPAADWGFGFFALALLLTVAIIAGGFFGLRRMIDRGYLDQFNYAYQDTSLLPGKDFRPSGAEMNVRVYLTYDGRRLTADIRRLRRAAGGPERVRLVLDDLLSSPDDNPLRSPVPEGTRRRGLYQIGRTAYLDMTQEFLSPKEPTPLGERLAVYALVNSIVLNDPSVDAVQLLVEGRPIDTAWGWLDCSSPLGANLSLISQ